MNDEIKKTYMTESEDALKDMVSALNELPTDVLKQLLKNLDEIDEYNKTHPENKNKK